MAEASCSKHTQGSDKFKIKPVSVLSKDVNHNTIVSGQLNFIFFNKYILMNYIDVV